MRENTGKAVDRHPWLPPLAAPLAARVLQVSPRCLLAERNRSKRPPEVIDCRLMRLLGGEQHSGIG